MEQKNKKIDQFHKNSTELVKVHTTIFKGHEYIDVRIWTLPNPADPKDRWPTHKGICINVDLLPRLIKGLEKAWENLEKTPESAQEASLGQG